MFNMFYIFAFVFTLFGVMQFISKSDSFLQFVYLITAIAFFILGRASQEKEKSK